MTTIFTCKDQFDDMMTCIYDAWTSRLGHSNIRLKTEPVGNLELFCEYRHVDSDPEKTASVIRSIQKKISPYAYSMIYKADCDYYLTDLSQKEMDRLSQKTNDPFVELWKGFFENIGIKERRNPKCQRNMLPLWYRKHMPEFH